MDLNDPPSIKSAFEAYRPHIVVHTAAMSHPDDCERNPGLARAVNRDASTLIANLAARTGAGALFVSTDLVFDGRRGRYSEEDEPRPLSVYGRTKFEAEAAFLHENKSGPSGFKTAVIRSSLIYGWGSPGNATFFSRLYDSLSSGRKVRLFTDQMRTPVLVSDLARSIKLVIEGNLTGIFHCGGAEAVSRLDFGTAVCRTFGLDETLIEPIRMGDLRQAAGRPLDATLDSSRLAAATGFAPRGVEDGLLSLAAGA
jgi:dTDP-4-dehydrorhamnose reductase